MANKMLIDASHEEETRVVVVRGNRVEEFDFESEHKKQLKGNIYLAKVTRVEPSLQAAFVEYGGNRHGFLAFSEIHPDYYQIPKADREALLADELARQQEEDEADEEAFEQKSQKRSRSRSEASARSKSDGDSISEDVDASGHDNRSEDDGESNTASASGTDGENGTDTSDVQGHAEGGESQARSSDDFDRRSNSDDDEQDSAGSQRNDRRNDDDDDSEDDDSDDDDNSDDDSDDSSQSEGESDEEGGDGRSSKSGKSDRPRGRGGRRRRGGGRSSDKRDGDDENGDDSDDDADEIDEVGSQDAMEEVPVRQVRPQRKQYKIQEVIKRRQILLVQVVKEERGNKGAALTTYLSLAGRYSVLMPNTAKGGGISRKITNQADRKRLKDVVRELEVPRGMGIILRTAGANRTKAEVKRDYEYLMRLWENVRTLTLQSVAPTLVYEEGSLIKRSIRDLYNKDIDQILVSGEGGYREAKDFMRMLMPSQSKAVQPYRDQMPIFARQGIEGQLDKMLQPHVTLKSGGYIIINQTEALVAIDVNSGRSTREMSIESTATQTNLEAAEEIARQLRLRDLAGLIVVDFIDMDEKRNNRAVEKKMKDCLKDDRARIQVGKISHFGLLEMSRQRIRASVLESTMRPCPLCEGVGMIRSSSSLALHAVRHIEEHCQKSATNDLIVKVPMETALYILNEKRHHIDELEQTYGLRIVIEADPTIGHQGLVVEQGGPATPPVVRMAVSPVSVTADAMIDEELAKENEAFEIEDEVEAVSEIEAPREARKSEESSDDDQSGRRKRRRRRRRRGDGDAEADGETSETEDATSDENSDDDTETSESTDDDDNGENGDANGRRRRRRGRRGGRRHRDTGTERNGEAGTEDADGKDGNAVAASGGEDLTTNDSNSNSETPTKVHPAAANDAGDPTATANEDVAESDETFASEHVQSNADERFDEPVATLIPHSAASSDETTSPDVHPAAVEPDEPALHVASDQSEDALEVKSASQADDVEQTAETDETVESNSEPQAAADTVASEAREPVEASEPAVEPLREPLVTSADAESELAEKKPRRTGWWSRRGFL